MALAGLQGCVDDGVSLHVICPIFPTIDDNVCVYDPQGEGCVLEGVMNLQLTNIYKQSLRVESGLKPRERDVPPRGEPNGIMVRSAKVDIRLPSGERIKFNNVENPFRVVSSGYIPPESTGVVSLTLITPSHAAELAGIVNNVSQIVLGVTVEGRTAGDQEIQAGEYVWPVRLLNGFPNGVCSDIEYCPSSKGQDDFATVCE